MSRPDIAVPFRCHRSGDCCRETNEVRMTHQERHAIECAAPTSAALAWTPDADPRFVRLTAKPCPLLVDGQCSVYDARPWVCRTFMCGRVTTEEPYATDRITGCSNLTVRLQTSERFRQHYATHARKTYQAWAREKGWPTHG